MLYKTFFDDKLILNDEIVDRYDRSHPLDKLIYSQKSTNYKILKSIVNFIKKHNLSIYDKDFALKVAELKPSQSKNIWYLSYAVTLELPPSSDGITRFLYAMNTIMNFASSNVSGNTRLLNRRNSKRTTSSILQDPYYYKKLMTVNLRATDFRLYRITRNLNYFGLDLSPKHVDFKMFNFIRRLKT